MQKIPTTIISGFLGSGKTSLIRHILNSCENKKLAFIINEFGDLGIDKEIILGCENKACSENDIVELANGCICCTVAEDFLPVMEKLLKSENKPDHIIIETSGLALPKPLIKAFTWPEVATQVTIDSVINVIDGKALTEGRFADDENAINDARSQDDALEHDNPLDELFTDQLAAADIVIINKCDLLNQSEITNLHKQLKKQMRKSTTLINAEHAKLPPEILLGIHANAENDLDARPSHHDGEDDHEHDDFTSFVISIPNINNTESFTQKLKPIIEKHDILRIKGFIHKQNAKRRQIINAAGNRISTHFDREWKTQENKSGKLVIIGFHNINQKQIENDILTCIN